MIVPVVFVSRLAYSADVAVGGIRCLQQRRGLAVSDKRQYR
jgi:hypothetical protein